MEIISRKEAKERGLKHYYTGKPCKRGHIENRFVSARKCVECAKLENKTWIKSRGDYHRARMRKWHEDNLAHTRNYSKVYYQENRDIERRKSARWREENPEKVRAQNKCWYERNRQSALSYSKQYRKDNPEKCKIARDLWAERNKERLSQLRRAASFRRRVREAMAEGTHTVDDIKRLLIEQRRHCAACNADLNKTGYHVDHIQPLARGGTNWPDNLQILCPPCNLSKGAKDPAEWAQSRGKLL